MENTRDERAGEAGDPGDPAMQGTIMVLGKSGVAESRDGQITLYRSIGGRQYGGGCVLSAFGRTRHRPGKPRIESAS